MPFVHSIINISIRQKASLRRHCPVQVMRVRCVCKNADVPFSAVRTPSV